MEGRSSLATLAFGVLTRLHLYQARIRWQEMNERERRLRYFQMQEAERRMLGESLLTSLL